jgi:lipopolysaccharide export system protein LptA
MAMPHPDRFEPRGVHTRLMLGLAALAALGLLTGASGTRMINFTIKTAPGKESVTGSARSLELDYKTHLAHLSGDVKISQGDISIAADAADATSLEAKNSHWVFTGNVHVRAEREGDLRADRATVEIINSALASAHATGSPAQFEQTQAKNGDLAKGHSSSADYDVGAGTVTLSGDAVLTLSDGQKVLKGPSITYNVREQDIQVSSDPASGQRSHAIITPKAGRDANAGAAKP